MSLPLPCSARVFGGDARRGHGMSDIEISDNTVELPLYVRFLFFLSSL